MKQWKEKIIRYAVRNRKSPEENRRRVGKSLSLLAVILFAVFLVNFAVIIGTGSKFGKDLVHEAKKVHQTTKTIPANEEPFMIEMERLLQRMRLLIIYMPLLTRTTSQQLVKYSM